MCYYINIIMYLRHGIAYVRRMQMNNLRKEIAETIGINLFNSASDIEFQVLESIKEDGYNIPYYSHLCKHFQRYKSA